jgi:hypothetical protein
VQTCLLVGFALVRGLLLRAKDLVYSAKGRRQCHARAA